MFYGKSFLLNYISVFCLHLKCIFNINFPYLILDTDCDTAVLCLVFRSGRVFRVLRKLSLRSLGAL